MSLYAQRIFKLFPFAFNNDGYEIERAASILPLLIVSRLCVLILPCMLLTAFTSRYTGTDVKF
jgi:hypothetical protein